MGCAVSLGGLDELERGDVELQELLGAGADLDESIGTDQDGGELAGRSLLGIFALVELLWQREWRLRVVRSDHAIYI